MATAIRFDRRAARHAFPNRYERGTKYNQTHLANVEISTDRTNRFVVEFPTGEGPKIVDLAANEGEFIAACTCHDFGYRDVVCKHIWAALNEPSATVVDVDAGRNPKLNPDTAVSVTSKRLIADGGVATMQVPADLTNGGAPTFGDEVEAAVCRKFALHPVDAAFYDARTTEATPGHLEPGKPIQIKGCQFRTRDGYDEHGNQVYRKGRWSIWREELLQMLADDGRYILVVYNDDREPTDPRFITHSRVLTPEQMGDVVPSWHDAHRPSKGKRAKLTWTHVLGSDPDV